MQLELNRYVPLSHERTSAARCGFTLVELLVSIAIIGVLISLLLPAVQAARESARRVSCTNNLKQMTLGALSYESATGELPKSGIVGRTFRSYSGGGTARNYEVYDQHSGKMFSWIVQILPYVEQQPLFDQFDLDRTVLEQTREPQATFVESFACPSDSANSRYFRDATRTAGKQFAKGNYAAYVSPMHGDLQLLYPGAFTSHGQRLKRIIDGVSNTIALSEVRTTEYEWDERGSWALPWNGATQLSLDMHTYTFSQQNTVLDRYTSYRIYSTQSQVPNFQGGQGDILISCPSGDLAAVQLQGMPCTRHQWALGLSGYISAAPRSLHIGGVMVSYLDGRVELVSNDVDPVLYSYEVGIQDGEIPQDQETDLSKL